jgi:predicted AAA+ superfamily ATPase
VVQVHLTPFTWSESGVKSQSRLLDLDGLDLVQNKLDFDIEEQLLFGSLPPVLLADDTQVKSAILKTYTQVYLEEEIRAEALVRKLGAFSRFLELAALESGTAPNLNRLSQQSGVSLPAIKEFYSLLEDTLIVHRLDPFLKSPRKRISSRPRYYFFDLGVRNALSRLDLNSHLIKLQRGLLFEHFIILELKRRQLVDDRFKLYYWRTHAGDEVDCVIETNQELVPLEIKASTNLTPADARHLEKFITKTKAEKGYIISLLEKPQKLSDHVTAVPWWWV